ncbi:MAG: MarR family winged helix-turn-helix transcriptional regulator [Actinomycetota bacterium]
MAQTKVASHAADLAPRLRLAVTRLARRLRQQIEGVSPSQISALHTIEKLQPVTFGELAAAEKVQPPTITRIVAVLEENGYVTRQIDPEDRRIARVALTAEGRKLIEAGRTRRNQFLASKMKHFSSEEIETLEQALPLIERMIGGER